MSRLQHTVPAVSRRLKLLAFFVLNPIAIISTFWGIHIPDNRVLVLLLLGLVSVFLEMAAALAAIRILKIPPHRAGSIFACGAFSNVLTIGGLIAYTFLDEPGYLMVQLTNLVMYPAYYLLGYPVSANVGLGRKPVLKVSLGSFKENPFLILPLAATALGIGIRFSGLPRPEVFKDIVAFIIPCVAATLGLSIGLTLRFTGFRSYLREIAAVVIILSCMPVAFSALVPPAIYGFDLDLANSAWMVSTGLLAIIVPVLFLVHRFAF